MHVVVLIYADGTLVRPSNKQLVMPVGLKLVPVMVRSVLPRQLPVSGAIAVTVTTGTYSNVVVRSSGV